MQSESEDDRGDESVEDDVIYTTWQGARGNTKATSSLRARIFGLANGSSRTHDKPICTKPGEGAGETETEADEPVSLPAIFISERSVFGTL